MRVMVTEMPKDRNHRPAGAQRSSETASATGEVRVRIHLRGGHLYDTELPADSDLLDELMAVLSSNGRAGPGAAGAALFQLPLDGGRTAAIFGKDQVVAIETTPPIRSPEVRKQADTRSVADLQRGPRARMNLVEPISKAAFFPAARKKARRYIDAFEAHRDARRQRLTQICDRLGRRTFVVSAFNAGFVPLLRNWVASCEQHDIDCRRQTILFPMDEEADAVARSLGFATCFDVASYGEHPRAAVRGYGDGGFASCVFLKLAMAQDMLQLGYDILLQDMDLVWFADPVPALASRALIENLDFQFMRDENGAFQPLYYNSGFFFARSNELTRYTWQTIFSSYDAVVFYRSDQTVLNQVVSCFKERGLRTARLPERYVDGQILAQVERKQRAFPEGRVVAHANWTPNLAKKIERLKKLGLWYLG